jgi:hypothetical protein
MYSSQLKITYAGIVLLDHGEVIDQLPSFPGTGDAQVVSFAGALVGSVFGRGNRRNSANWSRLKSWASHAEAQGMVLAMRKLVPLGQALPLTIEVDGGATFEIADFVMTQAEATPADFPGFRVMERYGGEGTELTITSRGTLGGDEMTDDTSLMGDATDLAKMGEFHTY